MMKNKPQMPDTSASSASSAATIVNANTPGTTKEIASYGTIACWIAGVALVLGVVPFIFMIYMFNNMVTTESMKSYVGLQLLESGG